MAPRKSDARRSEASVVVAAPPPPAASPAAAPLHTGPDDDDSGTPQTPANGQAQHQAAASSEKRDKDHKDKDAVTIEDLTLPKSIITRLAKGVLPPNTQIQANAILAMSKGATVFISYLASHANEHTTNANRKTISPADVFKALDDTEFAFLRAPLEAEFAKYNAVQTEKRSSYRQKVRAAREGPSKGDDTDMADTTTASVPEPTGEPRVKRPRVGESHDKAETEEGEEDEEEDEAADGADEDDEDEVVAAAAAAVSEDDDDDDDDDDEEDDDGDDEEAPGSGDETQDALESRAGEGDEDEPDEALDGDESD